METDLHGSDGTGGAGGPDRAEVGEGAGVPQRRFAPPPGATTVLLVRHGASAHAHPDRPFPLKDGHGDPPLAPEGHEQAQRVGARLAAEHGAGRTIHAIYVSSLTRTHQTAAPLAALLDLAPTEVPELREVHLGEWEGGALRLRAAEGHPLYTELIERQRWDVIPGAESSEEFGARLWEGLRRVVAAHPDETVVVVVHGGVIGQLLADTVGVQGFTFAGAENTSISELVVDAGGRWWLRRFNDTAHLDLPLL
ncbi:MAG: histidine phosphatase family protein [Actinomycetes bacterium]